MYNHRVNDRTGQALDTCPFTSLLTLALIDPVEPGVSVCPLNRHSVLPLTYLSYMQYSLILSIVYYFIFK